MGEELNEQSLQAYNIAISVLLAPHLAYILMDDRFLQASFDNLPLVDVLPTTADFEAAALAKDAEEDEGVKVNNNPGSITSDDSDSEEEYRKGASKSKSVPTNPLYSDL